jgi:benzoate membrane transport protein
VADLPVLAGAVVATWAVLTFVARRWAVPGALVAAAVGIAIDTGHSASTSSLLPGLTLTAPSLHAGALVGLALPLFIVTMASQNVPGMAVLASFGYRPPLRPILLSTGAATAAAAPFGAHGLNLAAITAAMVAGPDADPDPARRWIASVSAGVAHLVLGLLAGAATALIATAPPTLIEAVAGLALLGALAGALTAALADPDRRDAAIGTFLVGAYGIAALGIGAPFWGLLAGLTYTGCQRAFARDDGGHAHSDGKGRPCPSGSTAERTSSSTSSAAR